MHPGALSGNFNVRRNAAVISYGRENVTKEGVKMTRDEAKKFLTNLSWSVGTTAMEYWGDETGRKIREAVKAFEPEPKLCRAWTDDDGKEHFELINEWRWIPVTERLPEEDGRYLCAYKNDAYGDGICIDFGLYEDGEWYVSGAIAWMPLPKPYEEGAEE